MPTYTTIFCYPGYMQFGAGYDNTMDAWEASSATDAVAIARQALAERHDIPATDFYLVAVMAGEVDDLRTGRGDECREPDQKETGP